MMKIKNSNATKKHTMTTSLVESDQVWGDHAGSSGLVTSDLRVLP